jgi:hypothetical protein
MGFPALTATTEPGVSIIVVLVVLALAFLLPKSSERFFRVVENVFCSLAQRKRLAVFVLFCAVVAVRLVLLPLLHVPNPGIHDEFSYLLMGDTFAHGRLANPPHPMWPSFETFHVLWLPTYASKYPPVQGMVLALGELLGQPWIGVLLSAAAMCAAIVWALQAWMPSRWAFLAGVLAATRLAVACYWMNSYWGGAVAAIGGALVVGALGRLLRRAEVSNAIVLAVGVAILLNSRPYEAVFFCVPLAVVFFSWLIGKSKSASTLRQRWRLVVLPAVAILLGTLSWMGYYDWRVTGNPIVTPYAVSLRTYDAGALFVWQQPKPPKHYDNLELDVFYNGFQRGHYQRTWKDLRSVSVEKLMRCNVVFAWPALLLVLPALLFVARDKRIRLLGLTLLAVLVGFSLTTWSNPHYIAPVTCLIFGLVVQGLRHMRTVNVRGRPIGAAISRAVVLALLVEATLLAANRVSDPLGWGGWGLSDRADIQRILQAKPGKHLVMVRYIGHHSIHEEWVYNGADIDNSKIVWARDLDPKQNAKLFAYFKERTIWLVEPGEDSTPLLPYRQGASHSTPEF